MMKVSSERPDWSREKKTFLEWSPGKSLLASIRAYQSHANSSGAFGFLFKRIAVLRHRFWSIVSSADIPLNCNIGGGLLLPHPNGIVIHPRACIGPNCLVFQQVTIGTRGDGEAPEIGGHVDIGAGARVLGRVVIGEHACIGANAVVLSDVPAGATAVGIPARVID